MQPVQEPVHRVHVRSAALGRMVGCVPSARKGRGVGGKRRVVASDRSTPRRMFDYAYTHDFNHARRQTDKPVLRVRFVLGDENNTEHTNREREHARADCGTNKRCARRTGKIWIARAAVAVKLTNDDGCDPPPRLCLGGLGGICI